METQCQETLYMSNLLSPKDVNCLYKFIRWDDASWSLFRCFVMILLTSYSFRPWRLADNTTLALLFIIILFVKHLEMEEYIGSLKGWISIIFFIQPVLFTKQITLKYLVRLTKSQICYLTVCVTSQFCKCKYNIFKHIIFIIFYYQHCVYSINYTDDLWCLCSRHT